MSSTSRKNKKKEKRQAKRNRQKEQEQLAGLPDEIDFPFCQFSDSELAFGVDRLHPNVKRAIKDCPDEFKNHHNEWCKMANTIFFKGLSVDQSNIINSKIYDEQKRCLVAWLSSWDIKHEEKESVCGWLLSLMYKMPQSS